MTERLSLSESFTGKNTTSNCTQLLVFSGIHQVSENVDEEDYKRWEVVQMHLPLSLFQTH